MRRRGCFNKRKYAWLVAFGVGLLVACFCPPKLLVVILAAAVIVLGITNTKC